MIRSIQFLLILTLTVIYLLSPQVGVATPPSPSYSWVMEPHLHISERDTTYTKKIEVTRSFSGNPQGRENVVNTIWEPKEPSSVVAVASRAQVNGFGAFRSSTSASHDGDNKTSPPAQWIDFGSTGAFGPLPTWRNVHNLVILSGYIWSLNTTPTNQKRVLSGSGYIEMKQLVWNTGGSGGLPWGISFSGSWGYQDDGKTDLPKEESNGTGGYTIKSETHVLCVRHSASPPCKTYTMSHSWEHYVTCPTNSNGVACTHGMYYTCAPHTHVYGSGSGSQQGNGGGQQGNNGGGQQGNNQNNGGNPPSTGNLPPSNGGCTPPSNGGCTTIVACINTNCQLSPPCTTYTCVREIKIKPRRDDGSWRTRPCGATFTKCQDGASRVLRGECTGDRLTTYHTYHSDQYP